jgi:hypothetical protein
MSVGTTSMTELWHFPASEVARLIRSGKGRQSTIALIRGLTESSRCS